MSEKLTADIRSWVDIDNSIRQRREKLKGLVDRRNDIENDIVVYVQSHSLENMNVNVSDGNIRFTNKNTYQNISMKVLKELLNEYFMQHPHDTNVDNICTFVAKNRKITSTLGMVRSIIGAEQEDDGARN